MSTYKAYQQAKARISQKKHDFKDEMIVALWEKTAEALTAAADMKKVVDEMQRAAAADSARIDILETRLARANGTLPALPFMLGSKSKEE